MRRTAHLATVAATAGAFLVVAAPGALAQQVTDEYSGVSPTVVSRSSTPPVAPAPSRTSPSTLPFTGGEVVLLGGLGAGALAAGALLVAAGRRRTSLA
jgi:hypothetical protein